MQEAWIDDASAEDLAALADQLRQAGALEVATAQVLMQKGRPGMAMTALVLPERVAAVREVWLGVAPAWCARTPPGTLCCGAARVSARPLGGVTRQTGAQAGWESLPKVEHDELRRVSLQANVSIEQVDGSLGSGRAVPAAGGLDVVKRKLPGGLRLWVTLASLGFVAWALAGHAGWITRPLHFRPRLVVAASGLGLSWLSLVVNALAWRVLVNWLAMAPKGSRWCRCICAPICSSISRWDLAFVDRLRTLQPRLGTNRAGVGAA